MFKMAERYFLFLLLGVLCFGCKKDSVPEVSSDPKDPNNWVETTPPVLKGDITRVNEVIGGFYSALPSFYDQTTKKYPLLLFMHGAGQFGNGSVDLPRLLNESIPQLLEEKKFPANFSVKGKNFSFIILAPQFQAFPTNAQVKSFLDYAKQTYRVDETRIYIAGLSVGGIKTCQMGGEFTSQLAAIVPMAGVDTLTSNCRNMATGKLPVWTFHNDDDFAFSSAGTKKFVASINSFGPSIPPKFTLWPTGGHDAWTKASNPTYKENNMNIYEWMLQYTR